MAGGAACAGSGRGGGQLAEVHFAEDGSEEQAEGGEAVSSFLCSPFRQNPLTTTPSHVALHLSPLHPHPQAAAVPDARPSCRGQCKHQALV